MPISEQQLIDAAAFASAAYSHGAKSVWQYLQEDLDQPIGSGGWIVNGSTEWGTALPGTDSLGYYTNENAAAIAAVKGGTLVLAFRGSGDVLLSSYLSDYDDAINQPLDHYAKLQGFIDDAVAYAQDPDNAITRVIVTGHSLGGEMAQLFAALDGEGLPASMVDIITFGSPGLPENLASFATSTWTSRIVNFGHTEDIVFNGDASVPLIGDLSGHVQIGTTYEIDLRSLTSTGKAPGVSDPSPFETSFFLALAGLFEDGQGAVEHSTDNYWQSIRAITASLGFAHIGSITSLVIGDDGANSMSVSGATPRLILGLDGSDRLFGGNGNDVIDGGLGSDAFISGGDGADRLYGYIGDDILSGGRGDDTINGGSGTDTAVYDGLTFDHFNVSRAGDVITVTPKFQDSQALYGIDTLHKVEFLKFFDEIVAYNDPRIKEASAGTASGGSASDGGVNQAGEDGTDGGSGTSSEGDTIVGDDTSEHRYGGPGPDIFQGLGGNDTFTGYAGQDTYDGGQGSDTVDYSYNPSDVHGIVDLAAGTAFFPGFFTEQLTSIENVWMGAGNDTLIGDSGNNDLRGGPGNDTLTGGLGNDVIYGDWKYSDQGGVDTAVLSYTFGTGYTVSGSANALHIIGADGDDWFYNVESFQFAGGIISLSSAILENANIVSHALAIDRISETNLGAQANGPSGDARISADGRFAVFSSTASNLVADDTNSVSDVFLLDLQTKNISRVSIATDGAQANGASGSVAISADGRFVAFSSLASNLVPGDTGIRDIFVRDTITGTTERLPFANSFVESISADGRYVGFVSFASNLVTGDTNNAVDAFVHDRTDNLTERVSVSSDGTQANAHSSHAELSADGRFVVFASDASNLVTGDTNGFRDVFVHDRTTDTTWRVSVASDGTQASGISDFPAISADGRFVSFASIASDLVGDGVGSPQDIFVVDLVTQAIERVSVATDGSTSTNIAAGNSSALSADGRYVAFRSYSPALVQPDENGVVPDIFLRDRWTNTTTRISVASDGTQGNGSMNFNVTELSISGDGRYVVFGSDATNLVAGDTNAATDVFIVNASNGAPVARSDEFSMSEHSHMTGNVLADNSLGPDDDPDNDSLSVTALNGSANNLGHATLASGARRWRCRWRRR